jgi:hypothetical protein
MSYIKPQITPPSPLIFAILNGGSKRRMNSADLGSPRGKPAENTRHLTWRLGGGRLGEVWFGSFSSTAYSFFDDFSKLTWHLGHVLLDSFSLWTAGSFDSK